MIIIHIYIASIRTCFPIRHIYVYIYRPRLDIKILGLKMWSEKFNRGLGIVHCEGQKRLLGLTMGCVTCVRTACMCTTTAAKLAVFVTVSWV